VTPTAEQLRAWRLGRHRLDAPAPAGALLDVVAELCGIHAQLGSSAEIALWLRVDGLCAGEVDRLLWEERALVRTWDLRGTLHLLPAREYALWLAVLGTYRHFLKPSWLRAFAMTADELEALIAAVGQALRDRVLTRAELAGEVARISGSHALEKKLGESWGARAGSRSRSSRSTRRTTPRAPVRRPRPSAWPRSSAAISTCAGPRRAFAGAAASYPARHARRRAVRSRDDPRVRRLQEAPSRRWPRDGRSEAPKVLGAGRVVAAARDRETLERLPLSPIEEAWQHPQAARPEAKATRTAVRASSRVAPAVVACAAYRRAAASSSAGGGVRPAGPATTVPWRPCVVTTPSDSSSR
jgi:hypothetical protein